MLKQETCIELGLHEVAVLFPEVDAGYVDGVMGGSEVQGAVYVTALSIYWESEVAP